MPVAASMAASRRFKRKLVSTLKAACSIDQRCPSIWNDDTEWPAWSREDTPCINRRAPRAGPTGRD